MTAPVYRGQSQTERRWELLLVNDSCYLLRPLDTVFAAMDARACDWWGLQATKGIAATRTMPDEAPGHARFQH